MATGVLGLGSGQAASLNSDLIEKLKTAEKVSVVTPYETKISKITSEKEIFSSINTKVKELLEAIKPFDLYVSGGTTAFEQKSAAASGDSVTFDASDIKSLKKGFTSVSVNQLAQKDVYQSNTFNATAKDAKVNLGMLYINNLPSNGIDTTNLTYKQLADKISAESGMVASVEQVGTSSYRLVIKSEETGTHLNISGAAASSLGFNFNEYQSNSFTPTTTELKKIGEGVLTIDGEDFNTDNLTYQELADAISNSDLGIKASVGQVGTTGEYKLVFNATLPTNAVPLGVSGAASTALGISNISDGISKSTNTFSLMTTNDKVNKGTLSINGENIDTTNYTYTQLVDKINTLSGVTASLKDMGSGNFKLAINSNNSLSVSGSAANSLGFAVSGSNNILKAQNMNADIDGVKYDSASNSITLDGLKITANKIGVSSLNISEDNTQIETQMKSFITKYNELVASIEVEAQSSDSSLGDKSAMRSIVSQIKDKLFGSYGQDNKKSIFNFGIELDKYGSLSLNSTIFNKAVNEDLSSLKDLFLGTAEKKGVGTILKESLDSMTFTSGILDTYEKAMLKRETTLIEDKTKAEKALDTKYEQLALQFAAYGTIINQMESSFSGLKMMISQSSSGN